MPEFDQSKELEAPSVRDPNRKMIVKVCSDGSYSFDIHSSGEEESSGNMCEIDALDLRDYITHTSGNQRNRTTTISQNGPQRIGEAIVFALDGKSILEIHPDHFLIDGVKVNPKAEGGAQRCIDIVEEALK